MSEELSQTGHMTHGLQLGSFEFYSIGNTTLSQLERAGIIPLKDFHEYGTRKPDAMMVDRRDRDNIKVICILEHKHAGKFKFKNDRKQTVQQCNDLCQLLGADVGIATDGFSYVWFNPKHVNPENAYLDRTTATTRSYSIIEDENGSDFNKPFVVDQKLDEPEFTKLNVRTRQTFQHLDLVRKSISSTNSKLLKEQTIDPTNLAKQIWQDVWSVSGATPERSLYTFLELFIFKYLSDLGILDEDGKGNKVSFDHVYSLSKEKAFKYYSANVRPHLKERFPEDPIDHTTIINGTVLNPDVPEHSLVFHKILRRFKDFGELKNIDSRFKSKVFEEFMKENISRRNWGQFFTPRNIIDAMVEMSDIDKLAEGSLFCDPACGVGGFCLEPIRVKENGVNYYYRIVNNDIKSTLRTFGFDKGFEKEEQLTIILAKANMLIFLSELLKSNPTLSIPFSALFNSTFKLLSGTILGTLSITEQDKYDLIMSNPPYVTSGSSNYKEAIKNNPHLSQFYRVNAIGVEGLFLEWIVRSLKPSRRTLIIVPDGILNRGIDAKLRTFILEECIVDAIISLPENAFYRNPKKTYILALTKKPERTEELRKSHIQTEPVFTYLVINLGETLDVNRFPIEEDDLVEMVSLFNQFKGAKRLFKTDSDHCKIQPIDKLDPNQHWSVDRWWSKDEKEKLGMKEREEYLTFNEFRERIAEVEVKIRDLNHQLGGL